MSNGVELGKNSAQKLCDAAPMLVLRHCHVDLWLREACRTLVWANSRCQARDSGLLALHSTPWGQAPFELTLVASRRYHHSHSAAKSSILLKNSAKIRVFRES